MHCAYTDIIPYTQVHKMQVVFFSKNEKNILIFPINTCGDFKRRKGLIYSGAEKASIHKQAFTVIHLKKKKHL